MKKKPNTLRQELTVGKKVVGDLKSMKVLLVGTSPSAIEIAKNLALLNIGTLTLCDKANVSSKDLAYPYIFKDDSLDQPKINHLKSWLDSLQTLTKIEKLMLDPSDLESNVKDHELVIVCDLLSFASVKRLEYYCLKHNKRIIYCGTIKGISFIFFNLLSIENKERFYLPEVHKIANLTNSNPGLLTFETPHNFQRADFITIEGLEKALGFSNEEVRPVINVVDDKTIAIEDTSLYAPLDKEVLAQGVVTGVNFPRVINFTSVVNQLSFPSPKIQKNKEALNLQIQILLILKLADSVKANPTKEFNELLEEAFSEVTMNPAFEFGQMTSEALQSFKQELESRFVASIMDNEGQLFDIQKCLIGAIVSYEFIKISGRFLPFQQPILLGASKRFESNIGSLLDKNLLIIGAGGKTHELMKLFIAETFERKKRITIELFDENVLTESALPTHFFLTEENLTEKKSKSLANKINSLQNYLKVTTTDTMKIYKSLKSADIVLITFDQYNIVQEFVDMALPSGKPVYVLADHLGATYCIKVTKNSIDALEQFYVQGTPSKALSFPGLDLPQNSIDVVRWCSLFFELVFENFLLDDSFFTDANNKSIFYYLVLLIKCEMYGFLLKQTPNLINLVKMSIIFFKVIFEWYFEEVKEKMVGPPDSNHFEDSEKEINSCAFDFDNPLHRDFVISFVTFFNAIYARGLPAIEKKEIVDLFPSLRSQIKSGFNKFSLSEIEFDFKQKHKEINRSDKFMKYYPLRIELTEFDSVYTLGYSMYQIKLGAFNLESKSSYEFDHNFFNSAWSMSITNSIFSCLAASEMASDNSSDTDRMDFVDLNNCKSSIF